MHVAPCLNLYAWQGPAGPTLAVVARVPGVARGAGAAGVARGAGAGGAGTG